MISLFKKFSILIKVLKCESICACSLIHRGELHSISVQHKFSLGAENKNTTFSCLNSVAWSGCYFPGGGARPQTPKGAFQTWIQTFSPETLKFKMVYFKWKTLHSAWLHYACIVCMVYCNFMGEGSVLTQSDWSNYLGILKS